ncbi:MAG TPA: hypothetical protein VJU59_18880 [Paraburkholderia sp.]|uniref:hypothetical protein n=1 Tax=Paraburkholderia sp. TaxID=1926495 RepID=UPI002B45E675|nr:hypothetical protein [Paraburkholderia sp.]HKR41707.1 hypothetical protein [Paraburkholderia sp.]
MKSRSGFEICLPTLIVCAACFASRLTFGLAIIWMSIAVVCLGHRDIEEFPVNGVPVQWRKGFRRLLLLIFHLAWWPWYMRADITRLICRLRAETRRRSTDKKSEQGQRKDE